MKSYILEVSVDHNYITDRRKHKSSEELPFSERLGLAKTGTSVLFVVKEIRQNNRKFTFTMANKC